MAGWTDRLAATLSTEFVIKIELDSTSVSEKLTANKTKQLEILKAVAKDGVLSDILATEKIILAFEFAHYANSKPMKTSLTDALTDLAIAQKLAETIHDPSAYQGIDRSHSREKNRLNGLPLDEARQFFKSHRTRLLNLDKGRLDRLDKQIIDARRANMRAAEKSYIALQQAALGIASDPSAPSRGRSAGRQI